MLLLHHVLWRTTLGLKGSGVGGAPPVDLTITKINPQLMSRPVFDAPRDTRATVVRILDSRPTFTFIR